MFRVVVSKNNSVSNMAELSTYMECESWIAQGLDEKWFPEESQFDIQNISTQLLAKQESEEALKFLNETDWKVLRHIRQKALGEPLSLTEEQYLDLEAERSLAASKVLR